MTSRELLGIVKGIAPVLREMVQTLSDRIDTLHALAKGDVGSMGPRGPEGPAGRDGRDGLSGLPGERGEKGIDGKDGTDGLGFDDMTWLYDGERTFTCRQQNSARVKETAFVLPIPLYRGVYADGRTYEQGDVVTYAGASWHCQKPTTMKPTHVARDSGGAPSGPQGKDFWMLMVKEGREGRPGKDGKDGAEGKAGRDWEQVLDVRRGR